MGERTKREVAKGRARSSPSRILELAHATIGRTGEGALPVPRNEEEREREREKPRGCGRRIVVAASPSARPDSVRLLPLPLPVRATPPPPAMNPDGVLSLARARTTWARSG